MLIEKFKYEKFSSIEQTIIKYMLNEASKIRKKSIHKCAEECYTSASNFTRLGKKMGYDGWKDFKDDFLIEVESIKENSFVDPNIPFEANSNRNERVYDLTKIKIDALQETIRLIDYNILNKTIQIISKSKEIHIFANNINIILAEEFALKMNRIGYKTNVSRLVGEDLYEASNLDRNSCAIIVSYSGYIPRLKNILAILKRNAVTVIGITSLGNNHLRLNADYVLNICTKEKLYSKIANFTSNISIVHLYDLIFSELFSLRYHDNLENTIRKGRECQTRLSENPIIKEN